MKKILFAATMVAFGSVITLAQNDEVVLKLIPTTREGESKANALKDIEKDMALTNKVQPVLKSLLNNSEKWELAEQEGDSQIQPEVIEIKAYQKDKMTDAVYAADGRLLKYEQVTPNAALPEKVTAFLNANFDGWKIKKDEKVLNVFSKNPDKFIVKIHKGLKNKTLQFDENGELLTKKHMIQAKHNV